MNWHVRSYSDRVKSAVTVQSLKSQSSLYAIDRQFAPANIRSILVIPEVSIACLVLKNAYWVSLVNSAL